MAMTAGVPPHIVAALDQLAAARQKAEPILDLIITCVRGDGHRPDTVDFATLVKGLQDRFSPEELAVGMALALVRLAFPAPCPPTPGEG